MWFKVDDKLHDHRKFRGRSLAAIGLWTLAGSWCADTRSDGFVPEMVIRRWGANKRLAGELVEAGLWDFAEEDGEVGWRFHDWADWQVERANQTDALTKTRWARRNALSKNRKVCEIVVTRDQGLCRYCGIDVNFTDRRGQRGGTYDHVDPRLFDAPHFMAANDPSNLVVACRYCNARKKDRTPDEAEMPLLPIGTTASQADQMRIQLRSSSGVSSLKTRVEQRAEEVRSRVGSGSDSGRDGSGRVLDLAEGGPDAGRSPARAHTNGKGNGNGHEPL